MPPAWFTSLSTRLDGDSRWRAACEAVAGLAGGTAGSAGADAPESVVRVGGVTPGAAGFVLAALAARSGRRLAVIAASERRAEDLAQALGACAGDAAAVAEFPSPSLSPYQNQPVSLPLAAREMASLDRWRRGEARFLVLGVRSLFLPLPPPGSEPAEGVAIAHVRYGDEISPFALLRTLVEAGYRRADIVAEPGDVALRGGVLDLYPPGAEHPLRLDFFGDLVDSIRSFAADTQRSLAEHEEARLLPVAHFRIDAAARQRLDVLLEAAAKDSQDARHKLDELGALGRFQGIEAFLPAVAPARSSLLDHLGDALLVVEEPDEVEALGTKYELLLEGEHRVMAERGRFTMPPERLLNTWPALAEKMAARPRLALSELAVVETTGTGPPSGTAHALRTQAVPDWRERLPRFPEETAVQLERGELVVLLARSHGIRERAKRLLREYELPYLEPAANETLPERGLVLGDGDLPQGFAWPDLSFRVVADAQLFTREVAAPPTRKRAAKALGSDLRDLKPGDYVVHADHGIGQFMGLRRMEAGPGVLAARAAARGADVAEAAAAESASGEVMEIHYAGGGRLLLPLERLDLIQKYSGSEGRTTKLDKLGGTTWEATKKRVKRAMRDMAEELLKLYATRQLVGGFAFSKDSPWQREFEEAFEFTETTDQLAAINEVKKDMESAAPMDRLLCGDVGYGKTEVAMRAAFKAVLDGKQVAVLAPTTILAYQHYRTFSRRFASFPVVVEMLSRFRTAREQKKVAAEVTAGKVDIVIGTHRLLGKDVSWKDLGLVIVDEEQRFGVAQKERLKSFKKSIDVLAMSATPIPRTLNMSLAGLRDLSIIETPPKDRLAIDTRVVPFRTDLVREAIEHEIARGGQVFFVHNWVSSIWQMKSYIEKTVPGARVVVGHGQMDERELERSMLAFIERQYDVLLSTTIIENGIDIPAANTMIINRADRYGLSQLYQLRGRVGRSDKLAFAYLLVPSDRVLSTAARKRLAAIQEFSDLGAGFRIAARDLEIRGAGNLLGGEQSGEIASVGFETYVRLLEETLAELKGEPIDEPVATAVQLGVTIGIPESYVADEGVRMVLYKRVAQIGGEPEAVSLAEEMADRFGAPLPREVANLLDYARLKAQAQRLRIQSVRRDGGEVRFKFDPTVKVDPHRVISLLHDRPGAAFSPGGVLSLPLASGGDPLAAARGALDFLEAPA